MSRTIVVERIAYTVFEIDAGKRLKTWARIGAELKPITATTIERLRKKLRKISVDLLNGDVEAAGLEASDHRIYLAARELAAPLAMGVDAIVREYAGMRAKLGTLSLDDLLRFYRQHSGDVVGRRTIAETVAEFLGSLTRRSHAYREVFGYDLQRLVRTHGERQLSDLTVADLEVFINGTGREIAGKFRPAGDWRRKQVRGSLVTFYNFARRRKYLPNLPTAAEALPAEETVSEARSVWDPEHLRRALESVWAHEPEWLPWLALSSFANVRSTPTRRLDWAHVHWHDLLIEMPARSSKVRTRTTVQITPELASWLEPFRGRRGLVCPAAGFGEFIARLRTRYDLPYYQNILRRSYITFLLAQTEDEEFVARVSNTSVAKLRANYRQIRTFSGRLVTRELAASWFGTARVSATNIVQLELPG